MERVLGFVLAAVLLPTALIAVTGTARPKNNGAAANAARVQVSRDQAQIASMVQVFDNAAVDNDFATMSRMMASDYTATDGAGHMSHKDDILSAQRSGQMRYTRANVRAIQVQVNGDNAVEKDVADVAGSWRGQAFSASIASTRVFQRRNGEWQMVSLSLER